MISSLVTLAACQQHRSRTLLLSQKGLLDSTILGSVHQELYSPLCLPQGNTIYILHHHSFDGLITGLVF